MNANNYFLKPLFIIYLIVSCGFLLSLSFFNSNYVYCSYIFIQTLLYLFYFYNYYTSKKVKRIIFVSAVSSLLINAYLLYNILGQTSVEDLIVSSLLINLLTLLPFCLHYLIGQPMDVSNLPLQWRPSYLLHLGILLSISLTIPPISWHHQFQLASASYSISYFIKIPLLLNLIFILKSFLCKSNLTN